MGDEESIRKEVWEGRVPVCFSLADEEVGYSVTGERTAPEPAYVSYWRVDRLVDRIYVCKGRHKL